ncbi:hypothetical protein V1281_001540 [Nitrobacteraceae bacterium AZCC 2161]
MLQHTQKQKVRRKSRLPSISKQLPVRAKRTLVLFDKLYSAPSQDCDIVHMLDGYSDIAAAREGKMVERAIQLQDVACRLGRCCAVCPRIQHLVAVVIFPSFYISPRRRLCHQYCDQVT